MSCGLTYLVSIWHSDDRDSCLDDVDDEVRDRAAIYLKVMHQPPLIETYIKDGTCFVWVCACFAQCVA